MILDAHSDATRRLRLHTPSNRSREDLGRFAFPSMFCDARPQTPPKTSRIRSKRILKPECRDTRGDAAVRNSIVRQTMLQCLYEAKCRIVERVELAASSTGSRTRQKFSFTSMIGTGTAAQCCDVVPHLRYCLTPVSSAGRNAICFRRSSLLLRYELLT